MSSTIRHFRRAVQSMTIDGLDDTELREIENDLRACISLAQQERRRRTLAEFTASRDKLGVSMPPSNTIPLQSGSSKSLKASPDESTRLYKRRPRKRSLNDAAAADGNLLEGKKGSLDSADDSSDDSYTEEVSHKKGRRQQEGVPLDTTSTSSKKELKSATTANKKGKKQKKAWRQTIGSYFKINSGKGLPGMSNSSSDSD
jgi:hypothetical protein